MQSLSKNVLSVREPVALAKSCLEPGPPKWWWVEESENFSKRSCGKSENFDFKKGLY